MQGELLKSHSQNHTTENSKEELVQFREQVTSHNETSHRLGVS